MKKLTFLFAFCLFALHYSWAQYGGPRLFLDVPGIYFTSPDVAKVGNRLGAGIDAAFNVGSHNSVLRLGVGSNFTLDPKSQEIQESFFATPFVALEGGLGRYRSNGNRCAKTHRPAFTALIKGGARYDFYTGNGRPLTGETGALDYTAGVELGYFYIRDIFRNTEVILRGNYHFKAEAVSAEFGFKVFFNLRADRD